MAKVAKVLPTAAAMVPKRDLATFAGLPDEVKQEVLDLLQVLRGASAAGGEAIEFLRVTADRNLGRRGWSFKSLERKYYAFMAGGCDWRTLVNQAKRKGNGRSDWLTPAVIEAWKGLCDRHFRCAKSAYVEMLGLYRAGKCVGDVDWRRVWESDPTLCGIPLPERPPLGMRLPQGWSYSNLLRHQPTEVERLGARQGRQAARALRRKVRTTREGMRPGQQYMFDDLLHDNKVLHQGQLVRVWELAGLDVASGHKFVYAMMPQMTDDVTGMKRNLGERQMRFLLAYVLCFIGYDGEGCELHVENGTSAIREDLQEKLTQLSGGVLTVCRSGVDKAAAGLLQWGHKRGGNPNAKAHLESLHNLVHNRLDALPAQTGNNARLNATEDSAALEQYCRALTQAGSVLPPELAEQLRFPVLDLATFRATVDWIYEEIAGRTDHRLEGWGAYTQRQWRLSETDVWHSMEAWLQLPPERQAALAAVVAEEGHHREARLSPKQVWERGAGQLVRLPEYAIAVICGRDLGMTRPCPATGEIVFVDRSICPNPMAYRLQACVDAEGNVTALAEGRSYVWLINPFDVSRCYVLATDGGYIGCCPRIEAAQRMDHEAIGRAIGEAKKDLDEALKPLKRRGAALAKVRLEDLRHNLEVVQRADREALPAAPEGGRRRERRLDALEDIGFDGLATVTYED